MAQPSFPWEGADRERRKASPSRWQMWCAGSELGKPSRVLNSLGLPVIGEASLLKASEPWGWTLLNLGHTASEQEGPLSGLPSAGL